MIEFIKNYWKWILLVVVLLIIIIVTKKRKYFIKDIEGNKIGFKEFRQRWAKGTKDYIDGATPIQLVKGQLTSNYITLTGIICGLIVNLIIRIKNQWYWLTIILVGSLLLTGISQISFIQKYHKLKIVENTMKKLNEEQELSEYGRCIICGSECPNGLCLECCKEVKKNE